MPKLTYKKIVKAILAARPELPSEEFLAPIRFQWNKKGLSTWDGGIDINEDLRLKVIESLCYGVIKHTLKDTNILRFLLEEERKFAAQLRVGQPEGLTLCFNALSDLRQLRDVKILYDAVNGSKNGDVYIGLYKERLFNCGYQTVLDFVQNSKEWNKNAIKGLKDIAQTCGFDQPDWEPFPEKPSKLEDDAAVFAFFWECFFVGKNQLVYRKIRKEPRWLTYRDENKNTLLHSAVSTENFNAVKYLIKRGAKINAKNKQGKTAYQLAISFGSGRIASFLKSHTITKPEK